MDVFSTSSRGVCRGNRNRIRVGDSHSRIHDRNHNRVRSRSRVRNVCSLKVRNEKIIVMKNIVGINAVPYPPK